MLKFLIARHARGLRFFLIIMIAAHDPHVRQCLAVITKFKFSQKFNLGKSERNVDLI